MTRSDLRKHQQQLRDNLSRPVRVLCSGLGNQLVRSDEERFKYKAVHVGANPMRKAAQDAAAWRTEP